MRCSEVAALASDHIDGTAPRMTRWRVRAHLALCGHCSRFVRQLALTRDLAGRLPAPALDPAREDELVSVLHARHPGNPRAVPPARKTGPSGEPG